MSGDVTPKISVSKPAHFSVTFALDNAMLEYARDPSAGGGIEIKKTDWDVSTFVTPFLHPESNLALISSGYSAGRYAVERTIPGNSEPWRWAQVGTYIPLAIAGAYLTHEAGHFHHDFEDEGPTSDGNIGFYNALSTMGGINANLRASEALLLRPHEGVMSDIAHIVHEMDPLFYEVGQEFFLFDGTRYSDGEGDLTSYRKFRQQRSGRYDSGSLTALAVWSLADTGPAVYRTVRYARTGESAENPYGPGNWTLRTTGALSPIGVRLGLRGYYFLEGHNPMPSAVSAEFWSSPTRQGGEKSIFPFGLEVAGTRLPLPLKFGAYDVAVSGRFVFAEQDANDWKVSEDVPEWNTVMIAGGGGVHFQAEEGEFFVNASYKEEGFIPAELFGEGWTVLVGMNFFLDRN